MKKENLECRINLRVTGEECEEIREQAEASGLSVSKYVRRRVLGRRVDSVTDVRMLSELSRQGGLLKRIYSEKTGVALDNINKFIESLERAVLRSEDSQKGILKKNFEV